MILGADISVPIEAVLAAFAAMSGALVFLVKKLIDIIVNATKAIENSSHSIRELKEALQKDCDDSPQHNNR